MPTVLLIEDTALIRQLVADFLAPHGYKVDGVPDTARARQALEGTTPDVIICDLNLPGENGAQFCRWLRNNEGTARIPIIVVSAHMESAALVKECGHLADAHLEKPFDRSKLIETLRRLLKAVPPRP